MVIFFKTLQHCWFAFPRQLNMGRYHLSSKYCTLLCKVKLTNWYMYLCLFIKPNKFIFSNSFVVLVIFRVMISLLNQSVSLLKSLLYWILLFIRKCSWCVFQLTFFFSDISFFWGLFHQRTFMGETTEHTWSIVGTTNHSIYARVWFTFLLMWGPILFSGDNSKEC